MLLLTTSAKTVLKHSRILWITFYPTLYNSITSEIAETFKIFVESFSPYCSFRISYSYTPIEGVLGCIYDVQCLSDEEVAALGEPKELNETSSKGNFSFGDIVTYLCPVAKKFALENGSMVPEVEYKCQWNGTWSGDPSDHPECECK